MGDWSVKDLFGQIATWEVETINSVRRFLNDPVQEIRMLSDREEDAVERWVRLDTYDHYQEHGINLRRWLEFSGG